MRVLTLGTFDILHPGHLGLFSQCRRLAGQDGQVIVGINTDEFITKYKGSPPVVPLTARRAVIDALTSLVDTTVVNHGDWHQALLIAEQQPNILVVGDDWAQKNYMAQLGVTQHFFDTNNIQLCYVPRTGHWSTTELKTRLDALG